MRYVFGILVFLIGLVFLVLMPGDIGWIFIFVNLPSIIQLIITIAAVIIATGEFKTFVAATNALLSKNYYIPATVKEKAIKLFKLLSKSVVYASILFFVAGVMLTFAAIDDLSKIGPSVMVSLNSIFYGTLINLVFINPAINILEARQNHEEEKGYLAP